MFEISLNSCRPRPHPHPHPYIFSKPGTSTVMPAKALKTTEAPKMVETTASIDGLETRAENVSGNQTTSSSGSFVYPDFYFANNDLNVAFVYNF